jgi:molybdopterin-guanine dinucleotide biosynthesis protein A
MNGSPSLGAILLAGGRGSRVGGATKPLFDVGGTTLLRAAVEAATDAGAQPVTIVGPVQALRPGLEPPDFVGWAQEDPPFGGPAAGTIAGLEAWAASPASDPEWTLLLACDLPGVRSAVRTLMADLPLLPRDTEGMCLADQSSRPQWLIGLYRTAPLRAAASALPARGRDAPVRALMTDLAIAVVAAPDEAAGDIDTWEDLEEARAREERRNEETQ